jgi:LmbE family N-acetylglucosaminyl deacetylase
MPGSPDNDHPDSLVQADHSKLTGQIVLTIRETRPQVVVTFDPYGGYGHPDHIKIHQATVDAFQMAGEPNRYPDQLGGSVVPYRPDKMYYMTFSRRYMKFLISMMTLFRRNPEQMGKNRDVNVREIAAHEYPIHAFIDNRKYQKIAQMASQCHASQLGGFTSNPILNLLRRVVTPRDDTFMRAYPAVNARGLRERDLFVGVH